MGDIKKYLITKTNKDKDIIFVTETTQDEAILSAQEHDESYRKDEKYVIFDETRDDVEYPDVLINYDKLEGGLQVVVPILVTKDNINNIIKLVESNGKENEDWYSTTAKVVNDVFDEYDGCFKDGLLVCTETFTDVKGSNKEEVFVPFDDYLLKNLGAFDGIRECGFYPGRHAKYDRLPEHKYNEFYDLDMLPYETVREQLTETILGVMKENKLQKGEKYE